MREAVITDEIDGIAEHDFARRLRAIIPHEPSQEHPLSKALDDIGAIRIHPHRDRDISAYVIPKRPGFVHIEPHHAELIAALVACDADAVAAWLHHERYI